jgi:hypothetical protein
MLLRDIRKPKKYESNTPLQLYIDFIYDAICNKTTPTYSVRLFSTFNPIANFGDGSQDVQEDYVKFIDAFKCPELESMFQIEYDIITQCKKCESKTTNEFKSTYINIPTSVTDINHYITNNIETIPNSGYKCTICSSQSSTISRQSVLKTINEVIVLSFDKYKQKLLVDFPKELKISDYKYSLVAQSEHTGGHYNAICLRTDDVPNSQSWYLLDDSSVSKTSQSPTSNTLLAFYTLA